MSDLELAEELRNAHDIRCVGVDTEDQYVRGIHLVINNKIGVLLFGVALHGMDACVGFDEE